MATIHAPSRKAGRMICRSSVRCGQSIFYTARILHHEEKRESLPQITMPSLTCHPVYDDNVRVKRKKDRRGHRRWKRSQGRRVLAFILTLDGVSSAPIIELGWKRSAFAFQRSFQPWRNGCCCCFLYFAHNRRTRTLLNHFLSFHQPCIRSSTTTMIVSAVSHRAHY